jgi:hypothetical protein
MATSIVRVMFRNIWIRPLSSVLGCPLRFPRKIDVRFGSCFIYVISIYFRILVSNTISCGAWSVDPSGALLLCSGVHVVLSLVFCIMFYRSLFVFFVIFRFTLCCISFFDLRLLITSFGMFKLFSLKHVFFFV